VWQHVWGEVGYLMTVLLQISRRMWQWKNSENRPVFDEVMCRLRWLNFLAHPVYSTRTGVIYFNVDIKNITRWAGQSPTWGRPTPQFRVQYAYSGDWPAARRSHQCAAPPANHRSLHGCRHTAIVARGISAIQIDFPLGIAAPGGLTSGFALPI